MSEIQEMMLAVCFGSVVGYTIGGLISLIRISISDWKYKRRCRKAEKELAEKLKETGKEK